MVHQIITSSDSQLLPSKITSEAILRKIAKAGGAWEAWGQQGHDPRRWALFSNIVYYCRKNKAQCRHYTYRTQQNQKWHSRKTMSVCQRWPVPLKTCLVLDFFFVTVMSRLRYERIYFCIPFYFFEQWIYIFVFWYMTVYNSKMNKGMRVCRQAIHMSWHVTGRLATSCT